MGLTVTNISLFAGDNRETLKRLIDEGVRVHSVVTDPPYGLVSIQKRFGKAGSAAARTEGNDGSFARLSGGFMGQQWDATEIERDPEFWKLIYDILLPGGYCFAFSGSRTGHWQACAMETAGFVMHPMHGWIFGSGFPKAHAADKALDKLLGGVGSIVPAGEPVRRMIPGADQHKTGSWVMDNGREYQPGRYVPATDEATEWEGWAYGTQAQKPALEPIYLAQKPFSEKTGAANLLKHGVGAVNIDGCRVPTSDDLNGGAYAESGNRGESPSPHAGSGMNVPGKTVGTEFVQPTGRHPANLMHDGSESVVALFPASKGQQGAVSGSEPSGVTKDIYGKFAGRVPAPVRGDSGSAARFFHTFPLTDQDYELAITAGIIGPDAGDAAFYHPKAGKLDRAGSNHPTVKPIQLVRNLIRHITPPGGVVLDPFAGSGTTGVAARDEGFDCILMEREAPYLAFLEQRLNVIASATIFPRSQPNDEKDDSELMQLLG